jgi:hypothetical protein
MRMDKFRLLAIIVTVTLTFGTGQLQASQINVQDLLNGNTAFGKKLKWGLSISVLFASDGRIIMVDERGTTEKGNWWVNNSGELCTKFKVESCRKVSRHPDGFYQVHNETNDRLVDWTLAEITKGNPYGLE